MSITELNELIITKLGVKPLGLNNEPFGVRFDYRGSRYFVDINLMVEKVDGACLVTDSDARQLEKLLRGEQWDGTGLPPVGTECEVSVDGGRTWCVYKATSQHNGMRLIEIGNFTEDFQKNNWTFRPLRTERDKAIEQMLSTVTNYNNTSVIHAAGQIYDAIVAGKIDGLGKVG